MDHFLNGVAVENPRYRIEQLSAVQRLLELRKLSPGTLEAVLSYCCAHLCYCISEFEAAIAVHQADQNIIALPGLSKGEKVLPQGPSVPTRDPAYYTMLLAGQKAKTSSGGGL